MMHSKCSFKAPFFNFLIIYQNFSGFFIIKSLKMKKSKIWNYLSWTGSQGTILQNFSVICSAQPQKVSSEEEGGEEEEEGGEREL